ncbi:winged helix-turn-helix transcriptional regulator [Kitasatospora sp. NBC_00374]
MPPRVEYTLTEPGRALRVTISGLCDWTHHYLGHIEASATASTPDGRTAARARDSSALVGACAVPPDR